jgi:hypothetical protein
MKYSFHFQEDDGTLIWRKDWHICHEDDVGGLAHIHDEPKDPDAVKPFHLVEFDEVLEQVTDYQEATGAQDLAAHLRPASAPRVPLASRLASGGSIDCMWSRETARTSAPGVGLEPTTYGLTVRRSAKLSYPGTTNGVYQCASAPLRFR